MRWNMEKRDDGWCFKLHLTQLSDDMAIKCHRACMDLLGVRDVSQKKSGPDADTVAERPSAKRGRYPRKKDLPSWHTHEAHTVLPDNVTPLHGVQPLAHPVGSDLGDTELAMRLHLLQRPVDVVNKISCVFALEETTFEVIYETALRLKDRVPVLVDMQERHGDKFPAKLARLIELSMPHLGESVEDPPA